MGTVQSVSLSDLTEQTSWSSILPEFWRVFQALLKVNSLSHSGWVVKNTSVYIIILSQNSQCFPPTTPHQNFFHLLPCFLPYFRYFAYFLWGILVWQRYSMWTTVSDFVFYFFLFLEFKRQYLITAYTLVLHEDDLGLNIFSVKDKDVHYRLPSPQHRQQTCQHSSNLSFYFHILPLVGIFVWQNFCLTFILLFGYAWVCFNVMKKCFPLILENLFGEFSMAILLVDLDCLSGLELLTLQDIFHGRGNQIINLARVVLYVAIVTW